MKLNIFIIISIIVESVFCAKDEGSYLELDNTSTKAYLFSINECGATYICKTAEFNLLFLGDKITDCYYKNSKVTGNYGPLDREDPNECKLRGYANINSNKCYFLSNTSDENEISYNKPLLMYNVRYYDIVDTGNYKRVLTEYGWCDYIATDSTSKDWKSADWMNAYPDDTKINHINITNIKYL